MRTDLKVNYEALLDLSDHLKKYQDDAEAVEKELNSLNIFLNGQKSKALKKLKDDINEDDKYFVNLIEELKDLKKKINSYVSCMENYVAAETPGEITRVDTVDIKLNLDSMKSCVEGGGTWFNETLPSGSYIFPDDKIKQKEQKNKYERNYNKLENYRKSYLAPLKQRLDQGITDLYKIYDDYLVPFEDEDDNHRKKLNKSYKKYTSTWNKIKNDVKLGLKIRKSFITHFYGALAIVVAIALFPVATLIVAIAAVAVGASIAAIPKKYFGDGLLKNLKESVDEKVKIIKQGPVKVVKVMANDMADTVQTPEGVAGVVGDVAGMVVGGKIAKAIKNPKTPVSKTGETNVPVEDAKMPDIGDMENIGGGNSPKLLDDSGKFIDDTLENNYQSYLKRKSSKGQIPKDRLEWKQASDYWTKESPVARGNKFNKTVREADIYDYHEIYLENGKRLDSYDPDIGEIISRKATDLDKISEETFRKYLSEFSTKYSKGTKIRSNAYPELDGQALQGQYILEIPASNADLANIEYYKNIASEYDVILRFTEEN